MMYIFTILCNINKIFYNAFKLKSDIKYNDNLEI